MYLTKNKLNEEFVECLEKFIDKFEQYNKIKNLDEYKLDLYERLDDRDKYKNWHCVNIQKKGKLKTYLACDEYRCGLSDGMPYCMIYRKKKFFGGYKTILLISTDIFKKFDMIDTDKIRNEIVNLCCLVYTIVDNYSFVSGTYIKSNFRYDMK